MIRGKADQASGATLWRYFPPACLSVLFLAVATLYFLGNIQAYNAIIRFLGVDPYRIPFLDIYGVLSWTECHRQGIDVIAENPCDVFGRTLDYSPLLLFAAKLGLQTGLTTFLGLTLDILFLIWVYFLPPTRGWLETTAITLALLSSVVAFALERANLDIAIFVIAVIAANWALRSRIWRLIAYGLVMLAALIKYYPCAVLITAVRERLVAFCLLAMATIGVAAIFIHYEGVDFLRVLSQIENGNWYNTAFGAQNLPRGIASMISPMFFTSPLVPTLMELAFAMVAVTCAVILATLEGFQDSLELLSERNRAFLLVGCALIVACFFPAQNGAYRGIYFLFVLPAITTMWRAPISREVRQRFVLTGAGVLYLMWAQFFDHTREAILTFLNVPLPVLEFSRFAFWLLREVVWWWVVTILLALLLCLIHRSQSAQHALHLVLRTGNLSIAKARRSTANLGKSATIGRKRF